MLFTASDLAGSKAPPSSGGASSVFGTLGLPAALVAAIAYGVSNPALGIAARAAGGVQARCTRTCVRVRSGARKLRAQACMHAPACADTRPLVTRRRYRRSCRAQYATIAVFVLTGLALRLEDVRAAFSAKRAALFGLLSTLVLSPALAIPLMRYAPVYVPALAPEFLKGLALVCCVPTTLTTGVILTQQAGGNAALTLLLVIATNILGVFTMPFALSAVFGSAAGLALDPAPLVAGLAKDILAPLLAGIALRCARGAFFSLFAMRLRIVCFVR